MERCIESMITKSLYPKAISSNKKLNLEPMRKDEEYYFRERIAIMCGTDEDVAAEALVQALRDVVVFRNQERKNSFC